jgi:hypothetical protein
MAHFCASAARLYRAATVSIARQNQKKVMDRSDDAAGKGTAERALRGIALGRK